MHDTFPHHLSASIPHRRNLSSNYTPNFRLFLLPHRFSPTLEIFSNQITIERYSQFGRLSFTLSVHGNARARSHRLYLFPQHRPNPPFRAAVLQLSAIISTPFPIPVGYRNTVVEQMISFAATIDVVRSGFRFYPTTRTQNLLHFEFPSLSCNTVLSPTTASNIDISFRGLFCCYPVGAEVISGVARDSTRQFRTRYSLGHYWLFDFLAFTTLLQVLFHLRTSNHWFFDIVD